MQGILAPEDARLAVEQGVDGIIVSNHGGRQLDGAPTALDVRVWVCVCGCACVGVRVWVCVRTGWGERVGGVSLGSSVLLPVLSVLPVLPGLPVLRVLQHEHLWAGKGGGMHYLGEN